MIEQARLDSLDKWFLRVRDSFGQSLQPFAGKPVVYVEIGCWGGASASWVAKNILTHQESKGYGIDPYYPDPPRHMKDEVDGVMATAHERLAIIGGRWKWIREESFHGLRTLAAELNRRPVDILYIDGVHWAWGALTDFALAWPMLRVGSVVVFDDYMVRHDKGLPCVREAYEAIRKAWGPLLDEIPSARRQKAVRVVAKVDSRGPRGVTTELSGIQWDRRCVAWKAERNLARAQLQPA